MTPPQPGTAAFEVWWFMRASARLAWRINSVDTTAARGELIRILEAAVRPSNLDDRTADHLRGYIDDLWPEYAAGCELILAERLGAEAEEAELFDELARFLSDVHPEADDGQ
ncbi:MAG: hypothetical protein Q8M22_10370 [Actinomycetota bacterium]|nr:hypothetical protein [Actinomycetota bacterium]